MTGNPIRVHLAPIARAVDVLLAVSTWVYGPFAESRELGPGNRGLETIVVSGRPAFGMKGFVGWAGRRSSR